MNIFSFVLCVLYFRGWDFVFDFKSLGILIFVVGEFLRLGLFIIIWVNFDFRDFGCFDNFDDFVFGFMLKVWM